MSPEQPSSKIGKSVGERLRAARIAQHYTQSQLAAPDFSVSYISAIERGQILPSLRALEILASRLGLTSTQLLPNRSQPEERLSTSAHQAEHDEDEVELTLLETHILIMQGASQQAIERLEKLSIKRLKRLHQLQYHYLLGWAYYKSQRNQESEVLLIEGEKIAKELNVQHIYLRILNLLALVYTAMSNDAQALQAYQHALELLEQVRPQDPFFSMQVYIQMGQHYTRQGNAAAALDTFKQALQLTQNLNSASDTQATYANISNEYAATKNPGLALLYADKSTQIHNQELMKRLRSEIHHFLGHAIMQGDQEQARVYLDNVLQTPAILQDALTLASIYTRNAEWYFARQEYAEAKSNAQKAYDQAQEFGDTVISAEALIVLGRIEYAKKESEAGESHYVAGLDILERLSSHQELADESVNYAQLLEEIGKEHEAFRHFRRAFQSKQKLGK